VQGGVSGHTVRVGPRAHQRPEPGCCGVVYDDASEGGERAGCIQARFACRIQRALVEKGTPLMLSLGSPIGA